jgi:hypothetical protein
MSNESLDRIMSGKTWEEYCDTLKEAGNVILRETSPTDPLTRAEGFRYLSRIIRATTEAFVEYSDPVNPQLFRPIHERAKMGADNPDNYYQYGTISGEYSYRLHGKRNSINYLALGTYKGNYATPGGGGATGYLDNGQIPVDDNGMIDVYISKEDPGKGTWLPMTEETSSLIVRQTFANRREETPAELVIQRVGGDNTPTPVTPEFIDQNLTLASKLTFGAASLFTGWADGFTKHANKLPEFDPSISLAAHGDPNITYYHSYWKLAEDEALVIRVTPPPCAFWNFQLNNYWMESLDYRYYPVWTNSVLAALKEDGSVEVVVSHENPGVDNWISTVGHPEGTMLWRWFEAENPVEPATEVVKLSSLKGR